MKKILKIFMTLIAFGSASAIYSITCPPGYTVSRSFPPTCIRMAPAQAPTPVCKPGEVLTRSYPPQCVKATPAPIKATPAPVCKPGEVLTRSYPPQCVKATPAPIKATPAPVCKPGEVLTRSNPPQCVKAAPAPIAPAKRPTAQPIVPAKPSTSAWENTFITATLPEDTSAKTADHETTPQTEEPDTLGATGTIAADNNLADF